MEWLVDILEGKLRRYVPQRGSGLNKMAKVIGVEILVIPKILVKD
jgi:hypothetical protein